MTILGIEVSLKYLPWYIKYTIYARIYLHVHRNWKYVSRVSHVSPMIPNDSRSIVAVAFKMLGKITYINGEGLKPHIR